MSRPGLFPGSAFPLEAGRVRGWLRALWAIVFGFDWGGRACFKRVPHDPERCIWIHKMSVPQRVFATGTALLAGGSFSTETVWEAVCADDFLNGPPPSLEALREESALELGDASILARHQLLALSVAEKAWQRAGLSSLRNRLRGEGAKVRHPGWGCVAGTSSGNLAAMECETSLTEREALHKGRFHPYAISRWRGNSVGAAVTLRFGLGGCDFSLNAASGTGAQVVNLAGTLVRHGLAEVVVVVAADPAPPAGLMRAMESNRSVSLEGCARPLGAGRAGMNPSEGAACVVLESEPHAAARGARPLAEWLGGETANESYHLLAPEPGAAVLSELLQRALSAYPAPEWISLHATGTPRFDAVEVGCLHRVFGAGLPWVSAMKRTTGHALGASGVIEAVLLMEGLRLGRVPNWPANTDPALGLSSSRWAPKPRTAFQIGQGMGGSVVVNAFAALDAGG